MAALRTEQSPHAHMCDFLCCLARALSCMYVHAHPRYVHRLTLTQATRGQPYLQAESKHLAQSLAHSGCSVNCRFLGGILLRGASPVQTPRLLGGPSSPLDAASSGHSQESRSPPPPLAHLSQSDLLKAQLTLFLPPPALGGSPGPSSKIWASPPTLHLCAPFPLSIKALSFLNTPRWARL